MQTARRSTAGSWLSPAGPQLRKLVPTNGSHFWHLDRAAIARIIKRHAGEDVRGARRPALSFNYRSKYNEVWGQPRAQGALPVRGVVPRGRA